jgi:hypothetical protein
MPQQASQIEQLSEKLGRLSRSQLNDLAQKVGVRSADSLTREAVVKKLTGTSVAKRVLENFGRGAAYGLSSSAIPNFLVWSPVQLVRKSPVKNIVANVGANSLLTTTAGSLAGIGYGLIKGTLDNKKRQKVQMQLNKAKNVQTVKPAKR